MPPPRLYLLRYKQKLLETLHIIYNPIIFKSPSCCDVSLVVAKKKNVSNALLFYVLQESKNSCLYFKELFLK